MNKEKLLELIKSSGIKSCRISPVLKKVSEFAGWPEYVMTGEFKIELTVKR